MADAVPNASEAPAANENSAPVDGPAIDEQTASLSLKTTGITADEVALYDRQIRLWGMDAQEKIRNARILLVNMRGLGNEIAKNLVLAGIHSLTIIDDAIVSEEDLGAQFTITQDDVGKMRSQASLPFLQQLNPRVNIDTASTTKIFNPDPQLSASFIKSFNMVIATDLPITLFNQINATTHFSNVPFYAAGSHGFYGFVFADLVSHTFSLDREKSNIPLHPGTRESATRIVLDVREKREQNGKVTQTITKRESYEPLILVNQAGLPQEITSSRRRIKTVTPLLPCLRALWEFENQSGGVPPSPLQPADLQTWTRLATIQASSLHLPPDHLKSEFLRSFLQNLYGEFAPVTAFLGGSLAQDVINVLGGREQPIQNLMLFDGEECEGRIYALVPPVSATSVTPVTAVPEAGLPGAMGGAAGAGSGAGGAVDGANGVPGGDDGSGNGANGNAAQVGGGGAAAAPDQS